MMLVVRVMPPFAAALFIHAAIAASLSGTVYAQQAASPERSSSQEPTPIQLEEVIVTATKRAQSVREVPSTIDVLNEQTLETKGARELKDFVDLVPGVTMTDQPGDEPRKIAIRGVGPDDTTNQTVGTVLGDVPLGDPYGSYTIVDPDPWDLQNVEVLKGPQGTLFGASSLAGMIRYVPNTPVLRKWEGKGFVESVSVKDGSTDPTYAAALNVPLGDTLAFRVAGVSEHDPGVIDIDTVNRHVANADSVYKWTGRAMLLWQPLPDLTIDAWYMDQRSHADELNFVTNTNGLLERNDAPSPSPYHREFSLGVLDARYTFDWATLVSLTGYQHKINSFDLDSTYSVPGEPVAQSGLTVTRALQSTDAHGLAQELRLVSPDGRPWTWLLGAFYSTYTAHILSNIYVPDTLYADALLAALPPSLSSAALSPQGVSLANQSASPLSAGERALFGELTRTLGPFNVTLGGRLYRTDVNGRILTSGILAALASGTPTVVHGEDVLGRGFSPKASVTFHPTRDIILYTTVSRGFQYGGVNIVAVPIGTYPPTFKSSTLWNYEVGARTDWLNKTLRLDLTAFYLDWKNAQVTQVIQAGSGTYVDNVGAVRSRGVESAFQLLPPRLKGLSLSINVAYIDARTTVPFTDSSGVVVPVGTSMPNSPRWQTATILGYSRPLGSWRTDGSLEYTHTDSAWNDIEHESLVQVRNTVNLSLTLARTGLAFSPALTFRVDNLTDERKIVSIHEGAPSALAVMAGVPVLYSRPRTFGVKLSVSY